METTFAKRAGALVLALLMAGVGAANPAAANPVDDTREAGSIVGRLIDQGGDAVPFADVDADGDGTGHWASTTTDADGFYELPGLISDDYRVMFVVEGRQTQFAFGKTDWDEAELIPVGAGEVVVVNEQLLPTCVLTGRFTDADGQGVAAGVLAASFDIGSTFTFGGTGDQRRAVKVTVSDGVGTAPVVRMDQAGSISGTVTDPNGDPVPFGVVRLVPDGFLGSLVGAAWIQDGSYTLGQLGPYDWPLLFVAGDNPFQWSGGATDRYRGASVSVVAGETVGYHYQLREGTMVTIVLDDPGDAFVAVALNARTGDPVAFWPLESESGDLTRPVLGSQRVKFVLVGQGETFVGGDGFKSAMAFAIRRQGEQTINLN